MCKIGTDARSPGGLQNGSCELLLSGARGCRGAKQKTTRSDLAVGLKARRRWGVGVNQLSATPSVYTASRCGRNSKSFEHVPEELEDVMPVPAAVHCTVQMGASSCNPGSGRGDLLSPSTAASKTSRCTGRRCLG